jgi:hypothetical protein
VDIVFPQYQPQKARIYSWKRVWFIPTLITVSGTVPLLLGVLVAFFTERKQRVADDFSF